MITGDGAGDNACSDRVVIFHEVTHSLKLGACYVGIELSLDWMSGSAGMQ